MEDLKDFKSASIEEFWQFSVGGFFASGSFWLGLERFFTIPSWKTDLLFWICVVAFGAGLLIGFFGLRQLNRRSSKIDMIMSSVERINGFGSSPSPSTASSGSQSQTLPAIGTQP